VPASADTQEIEVILVSDDVSTHSLAAVQCPRSPGLGFRNTQAARPVLRSERIDARIRITIIDQHTQLVLLNNFFVPRHKIVDIKDVRESDSIVTLEEDGVLGNINRLLHLRFAKPFDLGVGTTTSVAVLLINKIEKATKAPRSGRSA
jgi:hypothetical protein